MDRLAWGRQSKDDNHPPRDRRRWIFPVLLERDGVAVWSTFGGVKAIPPKLALREELVTALSNDLATLERAQQASIEGATHEEAKPENDKDTRALEQSYLARGQASRVEELRTAVLEVQRMTVRAFADDEPIAIGALVTIEEVEREDERKTLWIAPQGGGTRLGQGVVQVVTPRSPLGAALLGK